MIERDITVVNRLGLHARAAAKLVELAKRFSCSIRIAKDGEDVDGKSILGILMLAAAVGCIVRITTDGEDEAEAM